MTATTTGFRASFPEFNTSGDAQVTLYLGVATSFLSGAADDSANRWDSANLDYITYLFIAHHLALAARRLATAQAGGIPGDVRGPVTSKSVDKVSESFDTKAVTFEDEAFWNQTSYGIQFFQIVRMAGAGGVQLGTTNVTDESLLLGVPFGVSV